MSDWGGILDDMRGVVDDASGFFSHGLGTAIARGLAGGSTGGPAQGEKNYSKLREADFLAKQNNVADNHNAASPGYAPARDLDVKNESKATNFENIESSWFTRLHKFGQIDSEVQSGKVNEGVPR